MLGQALVLGDDDDLPMPATNYEPDSAAWVDLDWYDRRDGQLIDVTWVQPGEDPESFAQAVRRGTAPIRTLGHILAGYIGQVEHKSLNPQGGPVDAQTAGLLIRRPVESAPVLTDLIGKEGSSLAERAAGELGERDAYGVTFGQREDRWGLLVAPILRSMGEQEVRRRTGRARSAAFEAIRGQSRSKVYLDAAVDFARKASEHSLPVDEWAALYCHQSRASGSSRRCAWCGRDLPRTSRSDARYCSDTCRKAANRRRSHRMAAGVPHDGPQG
jgi:hypothetical protein